MKRLVIGLSPQRCMDNHDLTKDLNLQANRPSQEVLNLKHSVRASAAQVESSMGYLRSVLSPKTTSELRLLTAFGEMCLGEAHTL